MLWNVRYVIKHSVQTFVDISGNHRESPLCRSMLLWMFIMLVLVNAGVDPILGYFMIMFVFIYYYRCFTVM